MIDGLLFYPDNKPLLNLNLKDKKWIKTAIAEKHNKILYAMAENNEPIENYEMFLYRALNKTETKYIDNDHEFISLLYFLLFLICAFCGGLGWIIFFGFIILHISLYILGSLFSFVAEIINDIGEKRNEKIKLVMMHQFNNGYGIFEAIPRKQYDSREQKLQAYRLFNKQYR